MKKPNQFISEKGHYEMYIADLENQKEEIKAELKENLRIVKTLFEEIKITAIKEVAEIRISALRSLHKKYKNIKTR